MVKYVCIGLMCFVFVACKDEKIEDVNYQKRLDFMEVRQPGIYEGKHSLWSYEEEYHQMAFGDRSFRLQTDAQDKYFSCELADVPRRDQETGLSVTVNGIPEVKSGTYTVTVVKTESRFVWLWDNQGALGYLIRIK